MAAFDWRRLAIVAVALLVVGGGLYGTYHWVAGHAERALRDAATARTEPLPSLRQAAPGPATRQMEEQPPAEPPTQARTVPEQPAAPLAEPKPRPDVTTAALPPVAPSDNPETRQSQARKPVIAIIIDDVGLDIPAARRVIRLPAPVTLAFLPYGKETAKLAGDARAAGHAVFVHLQMEPEGKADPGPKALLSSLSDEELRARTAWALGRVPGAVGANNHMGSRLTANAHAMRIVLGELDRRQMAFVDSKTSAASVAEASALSMGMPTTARDVFLDNQQSASAIMAQLDETWRIAQRRGSALAIGHPHPATLAALETWLKTMRGQAIFVSATDLIDVRRCQHAKAGDAAMACAEAERVAAASGQR
ncbi:divergent polysaccharide deacetylase family protein [Arboricoccus pini]|uniref:divergent polysaccharide deacetylase family protein n=1 Tax=Arboricoccus pini TaxID=1963835 RepID=UPI0013FE048A|nr:divergent polysaccharide deacetylase family protein [Arboricoccus pini]